MKIAILGAGATGCNVGGHLKLAGEQVCLLDPYKAHMDAITEKGLVWHEGDNSKTYFTIGREMPSNVSGLLVTIYFLAAFPLSFLLGKLNRRFTTRALAIFGVVTWLVGMAMLLPVTAATPIGYFVIALIIPSIGIAILGGMPNACALKGIPPEKTGAASGTISLLSNLGACLISALVIPYLSVFDRRADGTPDYVSAFPKVSMIMLVLLIGCLLLTFFFPRDKSEV